MDFHCPYPKLVPKKKATYFHFSETLTSYFVVFKPPSILILAVSVVVPYCYLFLLSVFMLWFTCYVSDIFLLSLGSWMTTCLGKSCSFGLPRVPFVNCCQFMFLVISLLVLRAEYGIWLYQFLVIAYHFTSYVYRITFNFCWRNFTFLCLILSRVKLKTMRNNLL